MHIPSPSPAEHEAVNRLFDLARAGQVDSVEFDQLDSLVHARLLQAYDCDAGGLGTGAESIS